MKKTVEMHPNNRIPLFFGHKAKNSIARKTRVIDQGMGCFFRQQRIKGGFHCIFISHVKWQ